MSSTEPPGRRLAPRLAAVAAAVPAGRSVVDVGCGDGQLTAHLRWRGHRVVPSELRAFPAARARAALGDCRLADGLEAVLPGEVEVAVVAGMGGHAIRRVLERSPEVVERLELAVLQPMQRSDELRAWLEASGFEVAASAVEERRRSYTVLAVRPPKR